MPINAKKGGFRKISSRTFFRRIGRCSHPLGCGAIEPGKSVLGVCQDSDTYGTVATKCTMTLLEGIAGINSIVNGAGVTYIELYIYTI